MNSEKVNELNTNIWTVWIQTHGVMVFNTFWIQTHRCSKCKQMYGRSGYIKQQYKNKHQNQQHNKDSENKNFNKTLKNLNLYFINRTKERSQDP